MARFICFLALSLVSTGLVRGGTRTVVLSGQPAPGAVDGEVFQSISSRSFSLNDEGLTSFAARLSRPGKARPEEQPHGGIWVEGANGDLQLVVRDGDDGDVVSVDGEAIEETVIIEAGADDDASS